MSDVDTTELDELQAAKVSGVAAPANGTPFLLMKAAAEKSDSAESDQYQEEMTDEGVSSKALSAEDRKKMPSSSFAFVDKKGGKHLPIHDEGHVKAALGRFKSQDFSEAKGSAADAKQAAARKIKSAAKKHGIEVSDESDVAEAAKKGAVQASLNGTATPQERGHLATGQSQTSGAVTAGTRPGPTNSSLTLGGATTENIPDATKVDQGSPIPASTDAAGVTHTLAKGVAVASLVGAMDALTEQRQAIKDGKYLQVDNPLDAEAVEPGSAPWEAYDSATLAQVAQCLAGCCKALDAIQQRECIEAASGNGSDRSDVWDLEEAASCLKLAMGVTARLAFQEAAEGASVEDVTKSVDIEQLLAVRESLDDIVGVAKASQAGASSDDTKGVITVTDVTKGELAEAIVAGVQTVLKAEKKAEKKARKAAEADEAEAKKNANNGGDISEGELKPTKEVDSDDINAVKEDGEDGETATKAADETELDPAVKAVSDSLETIAKGLANVEEQVAKFSKRPRAGGPSLDGKARGDSPAGEGRLSDVTKSTQDADLESLEKELNEATDPQRKSELGLAVTRARLMKLHETGQL